MARVRSFLPSQQDVRPHPTEVDCEYRVVGTSSGDRLLHLSTFGSDERASVRKSSQSLQFDLEGARELVSIIETTFPELRRK